MPRSIKQLKHREVEIEAATDEQLVVAVRLLERLPGVSAFMNSTNGNIIVDYWVDEYTLSDLESELINRGYVLKSEVCDHGLRAKIQIDEERERESLTGRATACHYGGVFAQTYQRTYDNYHY